jgi:hypothetical protein
LSLDALNGYLLPPLPFPSYLLSPHSFLPTQGCLATRPSRHRSTAPDLRVHRRTEHRLAAHGFNLAVELPYRPRSLKSGRHPSQNPLLLVRPHLLACQCLFLRSYCPRDPLSFLPASVTGRGRSELWARPYAQESRRARGGDGAAPDVTRPPADAHLSLDPPSSPPSRLATII